MEFVRFSIPVAEALLAAHERGIIHRDLKMQDDSFPVWVDFQAGRLQFRLYFVLVALRALNRYSDLSILVV